MSETGKKQWTKNQAYGAKPVADLVSKLLNPVIERRAGMTIDLLATWEEIVGEKHATHSRPEKLLWPRQASDDDPFEPATLLIACESTHALFLQHDTTAIINRVNSYFGFAAVGKVKLVQKPIAQREKRRKSARKTINAADNRHLEEMLQEIEDLALKQALRKLGNGVFSSRS